MGGFLFLVIRTVTCDVHRNAGRSECQALGAAGRCADVAVRLNSRESDGERVLATDVRTYPEWRPTRPWREWLLERNARLHRFINEQLYPYSPFYRRLFDANKIDPRSIRTVDDMRRIPFTTKRDIAPTAENATRHLDFVLHPDLEKFRRFAPKTKLAELLWTKMTAGD